MPPYVFVFSTLNFCFITCVLREYMLLATSSIRALIYTH